MENTNNFSNLSESTQNPLSEFIKFNKLQSSKIHLSPAPSSNLLDAPDKNISTKEGEDE